MTSLRPIQIAVVGAAECDMSTAVLAEETGRLIAEAGAVLITGGRGGVMEAASRGARSRGGITVGILPGPDGSEANPYLSVLLPTDLGIARNAVVVRAASAVIAIAGGFGTLSEIAIALKEGIPVVALHTWRAQSALGRELPVHRVTSAGEAVALALHLSRPTG